MLISKKSWIVAAAPVSMMCKMENVSAAWA